MGTFRNPTTKAMQAYHGLYLALLVVAAAHPFQEAPEAKVSYQEQARSWLREFHEFKQFEKFEQFKDEKNVDSIIPEEAAQRPTSSLVRIPQVALSSELQGAGLDCAVSATVPEKSMDIVSAVGELGHCKIKSVKVVQMDVGANALMSLELLEAITEELHGKRPWHMLAAIYFEKTEGCEEPIIIEQTGVIEVSRFGRFLSMDAERFEGEPMQECYQQPYRSEEFGKWQFGVAGAAVPIVAGEAEDGTQLRGKELTFASMVERMVDKGYQPHTESSGKQEKYDGVAKHSIQYYDVFSNNCQHFVIALLRTIATKPNFQKAVTAIRSHQEAKPLQDAFEKENAKQWGVGTQHLSTETKREMVRGASNSDGSGMMGNIASAAAGMYNPLQEKHCANPKAKAKGTFGLRLDSKGCVSGKELFDAAVSNSNKIFAQCQGKYGDKKCHAALKAQRPTGCSCLGTCKAKGSSLKWCQVPDEILFPCKENNKNAGAKEFAGGVYGSFDLCAMSNNPVYEQTAMCLVNDVTPQLAYEQPPVEYLEKCKKTGPAPGPGSKTLCCYRTGTMDFFSWATDIYPCGTQCKGGSRVASMYECPATSAACV